MQRTSSQITAGMAILLSVACSSQASIGFFFEEEPNNTFATAQVIPAFPASSLQIIYSAMITPGDVDIFAITLPEMSQLIVALEVFPSVPHALQLGVFDSTGTAVMVQNQIAAGLGFPLILPISGTYFIGVGGMSDEPLSGVHMETFDYDLTFSYTIVPGPSAAACLALSCASSLLGRRQRR